MAVLSPLVVVVSGLVVGLSLFGGDFGDGGAGGVSSTMFLWSA
jgi:hypothetical protein